MSSFSGMTRGSGTWAANGGRAPAPAAAWPVAAVRLLDQVEGFLGQADGGQRAAEAAVPQFGRQRLGGHVAGGQVADQGDRRERSGAKRFVEGDLDAGLRADVVDDSARDRRRPWFSSIKSAWAQSWMASFSQKAGWPVLVFRRGRPLGLDRPNRVALLFEQVELARDAQSLGRERNAPGAQSVAFLAGAVGQVGVVDPAVLEQAVLDELVDRHDRLDVFEVVEPRAIADLVQGTDRDQARVWMKGGYRIG